MSKHALVAPTLMEMCAISYLPNLGQISSAVEKLNAGWSVVWGPHESTKKEFKAYMLYIAQHQESGDISVIIRGSLPSMSLGGFIDWIDDVRVFKKTKWTGKGMISTGAEHGLRLLTEISDSEGAVLDFIKKHGVGCSVYVSGHSLGGCLAPVLGTWLKDRLPSFDIIPVAFAGPSAGDAEFANYVNERFDDDSFARYEINYDVVAHMWDRIDEVLKFFADPGPKFPKEPKWMESIMQKMANLLKNKLGYTQPRRGFGQVLDASAYIKDSFEKDVQALLLREPDQIEIKSEELIEILQVDGLLKEGSLALGKLPPDVQHFFAQVAVMHSNKNYVALMHKTVKMMAAPARNLAAEMMELSSVAYSPDLRGFNHSLKAISSPWRCVWGPHATPAFGAYLLYVAENRMTNELALVIRGSLSTHCVSAFVDWIEDLNVFEMCDWPYGGQGAKVAKGTMDAFNALRKIQSGNFFLLSWGGTAADFIRKRAQRGQRVYVTGHSLGGCQATLFASYLQQQQPEINVYPITFAAPSAGNKEFADHFDAQFGEESERYWNDLDVVPHAFASLAKVRRFFPPPGPRCPVEDQIVKALFKDFDERLNKDFHYQHPKGGSRPLSGETMLRDVNKIVFGSHNGKLHIKSPVLRELLIKHELMSIDDLHVDFSNISLDIKRFFAEVAHMHRRDTYLSLVHAKAVKIPERHPNVFSNLYVLVKGILYKMFHR